MLAHLAARWCLLPTHLSTAAAAACALQRAGGGAAFAVAAAAASAAAAAPSALQFSSSASTSSSTNSGSTGTLPTPTLTRAHLHKKERVLEVGFSDGVTRRFSAELLRVASPSADNAGSPWRSGGAAETATTSGSTNGPPPAARPLLPPAPDLAAAGRGRPPRVVAGRRRVGLMAVEPVGRYALRLRFDDLHDAVYPYNMLRELGDKRWAIARRYLRLLRAAGLSRDLPPPRPPRGGAARG